MAVFDTAVNTINKFTKDSEVESSAEDSSDSSPGLIGDHHVSKKPMSSQKTPRRSSRLSKGRDEDDLSDDSDPHIDMGDVMMNEEEKMMIEDEKDADKKLARKQQMAVALVKSVVMKKEEEQGEKQNQVSNAEEAKKNVKQEDDESDSQGMNHSNRRKRQKTDVDSSIRDAPPATAAVENPVATRSQTPPPIPTRSSSRKITKTSKAIKASLDDNEEQSQGKRITSKSSAPVPNPILKSPNPSASGRVNAKKKDESSTPTRSNAHGRSKGQINNGKKQTLTKTKNEEIIPEPSNINVDMPRSRKRIFSIDLDPDTFDFDFGVGDTGPDPALYRGRGMSFELFNFSVAETSGDLKSDALNGGRPRGDSIIFDPISFADGGIHEEAALHKVRHDSLVLEENDDLKLLTANTYDTTSLIMHPTSSVQPSPMVSKSHRGSSSTGSKSKSSSKSKAPSRSASTNPASKTVTHSQASKSKHHLTVVSGSTSSCEKEETLHMPQGSAAAAAAVASLSSQILQNTMNGTISHTSCPMDLLNKGGRIGIYLPEARRERISKFHSKRKNRIWRKRIKYDCRKKLADSRPRVKGRFVKSLEPEDE